MMKRKLCTMIGTSFLILIGCVSTPKDGEVKIWKSDHFDIEIPYSAPWGIVNTSYDKTDKLLKSFMDMDSGTGYIIQIEPDVDTTILTDEMYGEALIKQITGAHSGNTFLSNEDFILYHGQLFNQYLFKIYSGNWGPRNQEFLIRRDGELFIKIIRFFKDEQKFIKQLEEFDKGISLFEGDV